MQKKFSVVLHRRRRYVVVVVINVSFGAKRRRNEKEFTAQLRVCNTFVSHKKPWSIDVFSFFSFSNLFHFFPFCDLFWPDVVLLRLLLQWCEHAFDLLLKSYLLLMLLWIFYWIKYCSNSYYNTWIYVVFLLLLDHRVSQFFRGSKTFFNFPQIRNKNKTLEAFITTKQLSYLHTYIENRA